MIEKHIAVGAHEYALMLPASGAPVVQLADQLALVGKPGAGNTKHSEVPRLEVPLHGDEFGKYVRTTGGTLKTQILDAARSI